MTQATLDPENCPTCLIRGRTEKLNTTVRHNHEPLGVCSRMFWCFVCASGWGEVIECEEHP